MIYFIIFYIIVGIVTALLNIKADKIEGIEPQMGYRWLPLTWFPLMLLELITFYNEDDDSHMGLQ